MRGREKEEPLLVCKHVKQRFDDLFDTRSLYGDIRLHPRERKKRRRQK